MRHETKRVRMGVERETKQAELDKADAPLGSEQAPGSGPETG